ncbi:hypothetical protein ONS96_009502 [Cadophora gregata f. sp. sojae]|nr:hypothetical protein ONS96_009502 [Cadophora gregata f. sp. sojae]
MIERQFQRLARRRLYSETLPRDIIPRASTPSLKMPPSSHQQSTSSTSSPPNKPPDGSWDSHIHIIDPTKHPFPTHLFHTRTPHSGPLPTALTNSSRLHLPNMVFVQVSTYAYDNSWILSCLEELGPSRSRGVVSFDPETISSSTLQHWHNLGVRGVPLNLRSTGRKLSRKEIQDVLRKYTETLRPLKTWSIGLYADMAILDHVQPWYQN